MGVYSGDGHVNYFCYSNIHNLNKGYSRIPMRDNLARPTTTVHGNLQCYVSIKGAGSESAKI